MAIIMLSPVVQHIKVKLFQIALSFFLLQTVTKVISLANCILDKLSLFILYYMYSLFVIVIVATGPSTACTFGFRCWWPWVCRGTGALRRQTGPSIGPNPGVFPSAFQFASQSVGGRKKFRARVLAAILYTILTLFLFCLTAETILSICWRNSPLPAELLIDWLNLSWIEVSSESSLFK